MALTNLQLAGALADLPKATANIVRAAVKHADFNGQIQGFPIEDVVSLLPLAAGFSIAPISGFHVGAIAVGESGHLYLGANLEFQGLQLNTTLHAEQSAVLNAWMHGEKSISALYVSETPCGHCRQFLRELSNLDSLRIYVSENSYKLDELLPAAFGESPARSKGLLDHSPVGLKTVNPPPAVSTQRAFNAAQLSYTPYSQSPEGFTIECLDGKLFCGRAAESAAYNPSVPSILVALNQRNLSTSRNTTITAGTLAKLTTAINNPLPAAKAILSSISEAEIRVVQIETT